MAARRTKAVLGIVAVVAVLAVGAVVLRGVWNTAKTTFSADVCTVGSWDLDPDQAAVASTMVAAVTKYPGRLPERAAVLVLAAGLQESKLTNLAPGAGDRDSVGVLQQRPSQGWGGGSAAALTDVGEATKEFLHSLLKVPHWRTLTIGQAVQAVQISADASGDSYLQHADEAQALADALLGRRPADITCDFAAPTKVASTAEVAAQAAAQLGIDTPEPASAQLVQVPGAHWQTVAWFVANADRLGIERVAYAGRIWTRTDGWKRGSAPATAVTATMHQLKKS